MVVIKPELVTVKLSPSGSPNLASTNISLSGEYQNHGSRLRSYHHDACADSNRMSLGYILNDPMDVETKDSQTDDSDSDDLDPDGSVHIKLVMQNTEPAAYSPVEPKNWSKKAQSKPRDFRPAYEIEQGHFLWFLKIDEGLDWNSIYDAFQATFPQSNRDKPGLQCKFYRVLNEYGMPSQRELARLPREQLSSQYGFLSNRTERYSWSY